MPDGTMVHIQGGRFTMGSTRFYADEQPVHERTVQPFLLDVYEVTNEQFAEFVADTGYVTVAERPLDPADFGGVLPDSSPGALVFTPTEGPVDLRDWRRWWRWVSGACWRAPRGAESSIVGLEKHPVVQVSFDDAQAFATWAGKRLPTEAEFEFAAAAGSTDAFAWGDDPFPDGVAHANTWLGDFPFRNQGRFGGGTAPVGSYPVNELGLFDMIGNVWEWTSDFYTPRHVVPESLGVDADGRRNLLTDPGDLSSPLRVLKGGSYLCSPSYCLRFRPAARSSQSEDSATTHIGFRCARDE